MCVDVVVLGDRFNNRGQLLVMVPVPVPDRSFNGAWLVAPAKIVGG